MEHDDLPSVEAASRYLIGIDLGTTNCAVAYVDTTRSRAVQHFPVTQLVNEAVAAPLPMLPSFLYLPGPRDLPAGSLVLPWDHERDYAVGQFARVQGARIPGRLVSSAKSWLSHAGVERNAAILPWGGPPEVSKLSPVAASARYLQHIREAWNQRMGKQFALETQQVILTVPASFDEVARELTVQAAEQAGLTRVTLLEEPQAAFYAWLAKHTDSWQGQLRAGNTILVCDIGGGTTDFSLIAVTEGKTQLQLERVTVGDHLLLGGDNMDIALARQVEARMAKGGRLDAQRWSTLTHLCRVAKEDLFADPNRQSVPITLAGRGSAVVGGTLSDALNRDELERTIVEGFFPVVNVDNFPRRSARVGLQEFGLPYATEAEIPRHLAFFLHQHAQTTGRPDAILFNGGALTPHVIRERIVDIVSRWFAAANENWRPTVLTSTSLDLAVAYGAAYYGLVRRGQGVRIGGGSARAYYIGVDMQTQTAAEPHDAVKALCLVRHGMEEGEEVHLSEPEFEVVANQPVSFPLYASSTRMSDQPGQLLTLSAEEVSTLPAIRTVLRFGKKAGMVKIPVQVSARFTEIGTLELWCEAQQTNHRWRLQFQLRGEGTVAPVPTTGTVSEEHVIDEALQAEAMQLIRAVLTAGTSASTEGVTVQNLTRKLEQVLGTNKDRWPLSAIRRLWDVLWECEKARARSPEYEARWLNLIGFCLRPGFGHTTDEWRLQQLWKLYPHGPVHNNAIQCRAEWWSLWKRVASGLSRQQQQVLYNDIAPWLLPKLKNRIKAGRSKVGPQELREMWQVVASCERLLPDAKADLGEELFRTIEKGKASEPEVWAFARIGARALIHGPANCVVRREVAERWVGQILRSEWRNPEALGFAVVQLTRCTGDRNRDLDEEIRQQVASKLASLPSGERWAKQVLEVVPLETKEQAQILDESLPVGLRIRNEETEGGADARR
ncbi:MAG: hsp70 family protein [Deltaproteobacteria bacterium]|nr:hsp70 family protein [Deltaproteobacteria bacterium]